MAGGGDDQGPYGIPGIHGIPQGGYQGMPQGGYQIATTPSRNPANPENLVSVFCENNPNYRLAMRTDGIVLAFKNLEDPKQQWIKIDVGDKFKDQAECPGFILVNKSTGHALTHGFSHGDVVTSQTYQANSFDGSILWSQSKDVGKGYTAIRPVTNISLNLDADHGDKKHGGVEDGNILIIHSWNKQENQKWKIVPVASGE